MGESRREAGAKPGAENPMERVRENDRRSAEPVFVPGSVARPDFERVVRTVKAKMHAFARGPVFVYSPVREGGPQARVAQVRQLQAEVAGFAIPGEAAYLMRTSGSTSGTGKVVMLPTASLVASARATEAALGGPGRWVTCLPPAHVAGFQTVFRSLLAGKEPIWGGSGKPEEIAAATAEYEAGERAYISLVPTQLARLLDAEEEREGAAASLLGRFDAVLLGGAACPPELLSRAQAAELRVVRTYGMTETCGGCVYDGLPIGDTRIDLGPGGRIVLAGSVVALGYAPATFFGGSLTTSDAGRFGPDGRLEVLGRLDGAITSGGVTVIPEVVEAELAAAGCGEAVVVGVADATWGEAVVALVERAAPAARERLRSRLEPGWTPARLFSVGELGLARIPMLASGKPDRAAVAAILADALANPACP